MARERDMGMGDVIEGRETEAPPPMTGGAPAPAPAPTTPPETGGSEPPPPGAGDEMPDQSFPVPPVPPPPAPGPMFGIAGSGQGGPTSFARPGTEAAKPFRSPLFATNRGGMPMARFGAGTPVTAGTLPFLPQGLEAGVEPAPADELQRIMAMMRGGGEGV